MQTILGAGGTIGSDLAKELTSYTDHLKLLYDKQKSRFTSINMERYLFISEQTCLERVEL